MLSDAARLIVTVNDQPIFDGMHALAADKPRTFGIRFLVEGAGARRCRPRGGERAMFSRRSSRSKFGGLSFRSNRRGLVSAFTLAVNDVERPRDNSAASVNRAAAPARDARTPRPPATSADTYGTCRTSSPRSSSGRSG